MRSGSDTNFDPDFLNGWVGVGHCVTDVFIFVKERKALTFKALLIKISLLHNERERKSLQIQLK